MEIPTPSSGELLIAFVSWLAGVVQTKLWPRLVAWLTRRK